MAELRMSIMQARRNTELHMKRASIQAGAMRVVKNARWMIMCIQTTWLRAHTDMRFAETADPSHARLQRGVDEYFTRQHVLPSTVAPLTMDALHSPNRNVQKSATQGCEAGILRVPNDSVSRQLFDGPSSENENIGSSSERIQLNRESGVPVMAAAAEPTVHPTMGLAHWHHILQAGTMLQTANSQIPFYLLEARFQIW
ncbi:hypothetical protein BJ742DRAFT_188926 [Cladochytrium replicatum]|nr:hypothetical protein BJ742DRAFT_188926 [Cladochytrium replicatum]